MSEWSTEERGSKRTDPEYDDAPESGATEGLGDTLFAAFEAGGLVIANVSENYAVPLDAVYNEQDGGTSLALDTDTGIVTAQRAALVDGYVFGSVAAAASNGDRGNFHIAQNGTPNGLYSFAMDEPHLDAGRIWRLSAPLVVTEGDELVLRAFHFTDTDFTVNYAELFLVVTALF